MDNSDLTVELRWGREVWELAVTRDVEEMDEGTEDMEDFTRRDESERDGRSL